MLAAGIQFDLAIEFGKRAIHANAQVALRTQSIEYRGVISLAALNDGRKQRGDKPSIRSTSGFSITDRNWRA